MVVMSIEWSFVPRYAGESEAEYEDRKRRMMSALREASGEARRDPATGIPSPYTRPQR